MDVMKDVWDVALCAVVEAEIEAGVMLHGAKNEAAGVARRGLPVEAAGRCP